MSLLVIYVLFLLYANVRMVGGVCCEAVWIDLGPLERKWSVRVGFVFCLPRSLVSVVRKIEASLLEGLISVI